MWAVAVTDAVVTSAAACSSPHAASSPSSASSSLGSCGWWRQEGRSVTPTGRMPWLLLVVLSVAAASLLVVVMVAAEAPSLWSVWGVEAVAGRGSGRGGGCGGSGAAVVWGVDLFRG